MKVNHLLFDLDNTLYPSSSAMDKGITKKMFRMFGVPTPRGVELQKKRQFDS